MQTNSAFITFDTYSLAGTSDINATRTNFVFRNINLMSVLGEMWYKYDKFCIRLVNAWYPSAVTNTNSAAYMIQNNIRGLDWINCYDEKYGSGQTYMPVAVCRGSNTAMLFDPVTAPFAFNFRKGSPIVNIEFQITILSTNTGDPTVAPGNLTSMPEQNYTFLIQPAENNQNEMAYMGFYTNTTNNPVSYPGKIISDESRTYTYPGFNMRDVCREFWDKYEDYEIIMGGYMNQGYAFTGGVTPSQWTSTPIMMSGFCWNNNFTMQGNTNTTSGAVVGIIKSPTGGSDHQANFNQYYSPVQFKKSGDLVDITFQYRNYDNSELNTPPNPNTGNVRISYLQFFVRPIKKDLNHEKGLLTISSAGLTTTPSNLGVTNAAYSDITINNVDLRKACQSFWDKYTKFNIYFTAMYPYDTVTDTAELCLQLYCEGLNLDPQMSEDNPNLTNQIWNVGAIYTQNVGVGNPNNIPLSFGNTHGTTFYKSSDQVNLRLYVKEIQTPSNAVLSQALRGTMTFTIVPVEE